MATVALIRESTRNTDRDMPPGEIVREVGDKGSGMPYRGLSFPAETGKRPVL